MPIRSYRDLEVYRRAKALIVPYIEEYTIVAKQLNKLIQNWRRL